MTFIKVIYNTQQTSIKCTDYSSKDSYQLNEIKFYLPKGENNIFCIIQDESHNSTIFKLTKISEYNKLYDIYVVSLENSISCLLLENTSFTLKLITLKDDLSLVSNGVKVNLLFENFQSAKQNYEFRKLSADIVNYYKKIEELSKLNIKLYADIREVVNK